MSNKEKKSPELRFKGFSDAWEQRKLGELAEIVRGASPRPIKDKKWFDQNSDIGWLRISDVTEQNGKIHYLSQRLSKEGQSKTRVLNSQHLLLSIAASVGKPVINYVKTGVHDGFLIFLNPIFNINFVFEWLEYFRPKWQRYGQPGSQVNLNSDIVRTQTLELPSIKEQNRISEFLIILNDYINLHQRKINIIRRLRVQYLRVIFPYSDKNIPLLRHKNFEEKWEQRQLNKYLTTSKLKNTEGFYDKTDVLSVSGEFGIVNQIDFQGRSFAGKSVLSYNIVNKGDVVYTKSPLKVAPHGIIKSNKGKNGIVSTLYAAYSTKGNANADFIQTYFENDLRLNKYLKPLVNKGAKNDMKVSDENVLRGLVTFPSLNEQEKIYLFFAKIDKVIIAHQTKLDKLKQLKHSYLKKMFL